MQHCQLMRAEHLCSTTLRCHKAVLPLHLARSSHRAEKLFAVHNALIAKRSLCSRKTLSKSQLNKIIHCCSHFFIYKSSVLCELEVPGPSHGQTIQLGSLGLSFCGIPVFQKEETPCHKESFHPEVCKKIILTVIFFTSMCPNPSHTEFFRTSPCTLFRALTPVSLGIIRTLEPLSTLCFSQLEAVPLIFYTIVRDEAESIRTNTELNGYWD